MRNNADHAIRIFTHYQLRYITKLPYEDCFVTSADFDAAFTPISSSTIFYKYNSISILPAKDLETELPNDIKIYRDKKTVNINTCLVSKYFTIWESLGFVQVLPKYWMKIYLKFG